MKLLTFVAIITTGVLSTPSVCQAQTDSPVPKPGLYKGTMTARSQSYGDQVAPVSSATPIVARVSDPFSDGKIRAVIRLKPASDIDDPLRDYTLEYDGNFEGYVLYKNGNGVGVASELGLRKITITYTSLQFSAGNVQSLYTVRMVLRRVGP